MAAANNWWELEKIWSDGEVRAPTLQRDRPRRKKRRAPDIPIVEDLANGDYSVTFGPFVGTSEPTKQDYPVAIYRPMMQDMHPLNQEMQDRAQVIEARAMREAERLVAARDAESLRLANRGQGQPVIVMPSSILGHMRANWIYILLFILVAIVAILAFVIGEY